MDARVRAKDFHAMGAIEVVSKLILRRALMQIMFVVRI